MIREPARVRLELESHPENVALVRAVLSGLGEAAQFSAAFLADLKTAVSEACNNSALHAYDTSGPMVVEVAVTHDGVEVNVRDFGRGIRRVIASERRMGLGLAVISALADRAEFSTPDGGGTEVRMWFAQETNTSVYPASMTDAAEAVLATEEAQLDGSLNGDVVAWLSPVALARYVFGPVVRMLAATSHFSVTRVLDLQSVNDAVAEYAELAADGGVGVAISSSSRRLVITGGPFRPLLARGDFLTDDGVGATDPLDARRRVLAGVVDELSVEQVDDRELLRLVLVDASREAG